MQSSQRNIAVLFARHRLLLPAQRLDDINQRIRELESRQRSVDLEVANIVKRVDDETARLGALMVADVPLPKVGRVWEALHS